MVEFVAAKKAAISTKALKEFSLPFLVSNAGGFPSSTKTNGGFELEAGKYKITFLEGAAPFGDYKDFGAGGMQLALPTAGTLETVIVMKNGKTQYTLDKLNLPVKDISDRIGDAGTSAEEFAAFVFKGDDEIRGSNKKDKLLAFEGDDIVWGRKGNDKVNPGDGSDIVCFNEPFNKKHADKVQGFNEAEDMVQLGKKFQKKLGDTLDANEFVDGKNATKDFAQLLYDGKKAWIDVDGQGGKDPTLIAKFGGNPDLTMDHFDIVV